MGEEKTSELKLVDVSFKASLKFWLAYLVVQIIAMVIVFGIIFAFLAFLRTLIPTPYPYATVVLSQLNTISSI